MTDEKEIIKGYTNGLEVGKLYIGIPGEEKEYDIRYAGEDQKQTIFNPDTYDFHLYPDIDENKYGEEDAKKTIETFCEETRQLRIDIIAEMMKNAKGQAKQVKGAEFRESIIKNDNLLYINEAGGRNGTLYPLNGGKYSEKI